MSCCTAFSKPNRVLQIVNRQFYTAGLRCFAPGNRIARALLAVMLGAALVESAPRQALAADHPMTVPAHLLQKAWQEGTVRVIVRLGAPFAPEGLLRDEIAVELQRGDIADVGARVLSGLSGTRHRVIHRYETVPFLALELGPDALILLGQLAGLVAEVHADEEERPLLAESVPLVRANAAQAVGFGGGGKIVAIIDSGIDKNHPFLVGRVVEEACYSSSGHCPNGTMQQLGPGSGVACPFAECEHGTHVAGIVAGSGAGSSGVAPGAQLMAVRAASLSTSCAPDPSPCVRYSMSDQMKALERVFLLRGIYSFAAVNISLGGMAQLGACDSDPRKPLIDNLRSAGIATVIASGNNGSASGLSVPACISTAVSVGSTDDGSEGTAPDRVSSFSNSSPLLSLLAPGRWIRSSIPGGGFAIFAGTSMAAPHVAGTFAILKQAFPSADVDRLESILQGIGLPVGDPRNGLIRSRIRVAEALRWVESSSFIAGFYQSVLGRQPDPTGWESWTAYLYSTCNAAAFGNVGQAFLDSVEFRTARPVTLSGLATILYQTFLSRAPDPGGLAGWVGAFRGARVNMATTGFIPSAEFQGLVTDRTNASQVRPVVTRFYTEILGRAPEAAGLENWVQYITRTRDLEGAAIGFLTSPEFEARALTFRGYVTVLYRAFLGRNPDAGGLDGWEGILRQHLLNTVNGAFIPSPEFQGRIPGICVR